jgi:hypothetical protein
MTDGRFSNESHTEAFLERTIRPAYLGFFDFVSGPVRIWGPGAFPLQWGGFEWAGGGALVRIGDLEESTDGRAITTEVELSPIPREIDGFDVDVLREALDQDWHGRTAILYAGLFESNSLRWKMEPLQYRKGFMDVMELTEAGQTGRIRITIEKEDYDNQRTDVRRYTPAAQRALYPGDAFFDQVPSLQDKLITWNLG